MGEIFMSLTLAKTTSKQKFPGIYHNFEGHTTEIIKKYNQDKITYTFNSQGYRCNEFEDIKWNESILALGCSYTQGIGLDDKECWSYQLQELTACPVVNLGQSGTSIFYHLYNLEILHKLKPKYVILQVPNLHRFTVLSEDNKNRNLGWGWSISPEQILQISKNREIRRDFDFLQVWTETNSHLQYAKFAINYIKTMFKDKCFFFGVFDAEKKINYYYDFLDIHVGLDDVARDFAHAGPVSHKDWATQLSQAIF